MTRATWLTKSGYRLLDDWGALVRRMFPGHGGPYLVGSALTTDTYRDVDVRVMLEDQALADLARVVCLADLHLCVSLWGQRVTGLPVDFQLQGMDAANAEFTGRRHPLGLAPGP